MSGPNLESATYRYYNDPEFHSVVNALAHLLTETSLNDAALKEAIALAERIAEPRRVLHRLRKR